MTHVHRVAWLCTVLAWVVPVYAQQPSPRYASVLESELDALGLQPQCMVLSPAVYDCIYPARSRLDKRDLRAHALYDDTTDTVYVYVTLLSLPENSPALPRLLRRSMELNWELLAAKFEWNAQLGELRVSSVMHTDSNFDRRALRALVRSLDRVIVHHWPELEHLASS